MKEAISLLCGLVVGAALCHAWHVDRSIRWDETESAAATEAAPIPDPWPSEPPPFPDRVPSESDADALGGNAFRWVPGHWEEIEPLQPVDSASITEQAELVRVLQAVVDADDLDPEKRYQLLSDLFRAKISSCKGWTRLEQARKKPEPPKPDEPRPDPTAQSKAGRYIESIGGFPPVPPVPLRQGTAVY